MNCQDAQNLIDAYADAELDLIRTVEIEQHLGECPLCAQKLNSQEALKNAIHAAPLSYKAPARLEQRIRASLRAAARNQSPDRRRSRWWFTIGVPAAAAALIVMSILPLVRRPSADDLLAREVVSSHIRSLMPGHLADVPSADQHTVKPWFNGKLDFSPPVEDLAQQGFPLVGGRLDYIDERPVAALIYQRRKHWINVFVWPAGSRFDSSPKPLLRQGYNLFTWTKAGMTYWAASDLDQRELGEFVRLLRAEM